VILMSLSNITACPERFGVTGPLLDITALELSKLAAAAHLDQFSSASKDMAVTSLFAYS
jgi:hypothetical protein